MRTVSPYQEKSHARPLLFWQHVIVTMGLLAVIWLELPYAFVNKVFALPHVLPDSGVCYVALDPVYSAQMLRKPLSFWTLGRMNNRAVSGLDLTTLPLGTPLGRPDVLDHGIHFPPVWRPSAIERLPPDAPEIRAPASPDRYQTEGAKMPPEGLHVVVGADLKAAGFTFTKETFTPEQDRIGQCRFHLETDAQGAVQHLLVLSPVSPDTILLERLLMRSRAKSAAQGTVSFQWMFKK